MAMNAKLSHVANNNLCQMLTFKLPLFSHFFLSTDNQIDTRRATTCIFLDTKISTFPVQNDDCLAFDKIIIQQMTDFNITFDIGQLLPCSL